MADRPVSSPTPGAERPGGEPARPRWSPSIDSGVYLDKAAPTWLGPWRLPQVRAQALQALIGDLTGVSRTVHGLLATALGVGGAGLLILTDQWLQSPTISALVAIAGTLCLLGWLVWGLILIRGGWRVIAATRRWQLAPQRSHSSGAAVYSAGVRQLFRPVLVLRIVVAIALILLGAWIVLGTLGEPDSEVTTTGLAGWILLAVVLTTGASTVLAGVLAMIGALRAEPARSAGASARGFAPAVPPPGETSVLGWQAAAGDHQELEHTRIVNHPGRADASATPQAKEGIAVVVDEDRHLLAEGTTLLGRAPQGRQGEDLRALLSVDDAAVSKTHLELRVEDQVLFVVDRASTNGTVVTGPDGHRTELTPWLQAPVAPGYTVALGATRIRVLHR